VKSSAVKWIAFTISKPLSCKVVLKSTVHSGAEISRPAPESSYGAHRGQSREQQGMLELSVPWNVFEQRSVSLRSKADKG